MPRWSAIREMSSRSRGGDGSLRFGDVAPRDRATLAGMRAMRTATWISISSAIVLLTTVACTKVAPATDTPVAECTKAEQRCQYADGKIGLCTPNAMGCDAGGPCLTCMSLH